MGHRSNDPPAPGDVPPIIELRRELDHVFLAVVKRYQLAGLSEDESREYAFTFILATLKRVTIEIEPPVEDASVGELWSYLSRQRPRVWWILLSAFTALLVAAFSLGALLGRS